MLRAAFMIAFALIYAGLPAPAWSQTAEELKRRIEQLERENASLRKENITLRNRVMALEGGSGKTKVATNNTRNESTAAKKSAAIDDPKWSAWLEFGGNYSSERSRTESGLFAPLWQSPNTLLFADIRGKLFEENVTEGNFALGIRHMLPSGWNLGAWAGYDVRRSTTGNVFHQAALGVEALHEMWDFRLNGYLPISDAKSSPGTASVFLSGNQILMSGGAEVPLYGIDGEVGARVFGDDRGSELRLYAGGFWFDHEDTLREVAGPKARAEWRINDVLPTLPGSRLTFEAGIRHDDVRNTDWEVGAKLRIPFGGGVEQTVRTASLTAQERRMTEAIQRDADIVTAGSGSEAVADALTGAKFDKVAFAVGGGSITTTATNAGGNTLIIAHSGTFNGDETLQANQTLQGGGSTIAVRGQKSGAVGSFTAPGSRPTIAIAGGGDNLTFGGGNAHVAGMELVGDPGALGNQRLVFADNVQNVHVTDSLLRDAGTQGVIFINGATGTMSGVTIENTFNTGIVVTTGSSLALRNSSVVDVANGAGISVFDGSTLIADNIFVADVSSFGIAVGESVATITNAVVLDTGSHGLGIVGSGSVVAMSNSLFGPTIGGDGINIGAAGNTLSGSGNTAEGATFGGQFCNVTGAQTGSFGFVDRGTALPGPGSCP